jgi:hypothetical protein
MNASHFWLSRVEAYLAHRRRFGYTLAIEEAVLKGLPALLMSANKPA